MSTISRSTPTKRPIELIPELEDGGRLTRAEFERRYEAMPVLKNAELIEGRAPHMVAEFAASSANYDLGVELQLYRRNGVREYVVWRILDSQVDSFVLREGRYESITLAADGLYRSTVVLGLWLDPVAPLNHDQARVVAVFQEGLKTEKHAGFVARLERATTMTGTHVPSPNHPR
jgi:hypothetical protein